jgi:hypothetical protein
MKRKRAGENEPEYDGQNVVAPPTPFPGSPTPVA